MSERSLLAFDPGSSSIKLGVFGVGLGRVRKTGSGEIDLRLSPLRLRIDQDGRTVDTPLNAAVTDDLHAVIEQVLAWVARHFAVGDLAAVGHRVVHGGDLFDGPIVITDETLAALGGQGRIL